MKTQARAEVQLQHAWPGRYIEVSDQLHVQAALTQETELPVHIR
jgi:hypothetical protein